MEIDKINGDYKNLISQISAMYAQAQENAVSAVNRYLVETYWQIGKYIVEFEQGGKAKAEYGALLLEKLSQDLSLMHGKGFSRSNLTYMRLFYQRYPICETVSHKLSWSHICELAREKDELLVKYAMHNVSSQLFVSKYQLYLPNREELKALLEKQLQITTTD